MKKLYIAVFALCLATPVMAAVGVDFGSNWYKVNYTTNVGDHLMGQGQNMLVWWGLDNDITVGAYAETDSISDGNGNSYTFEATAIQVAKGVVKNVVAGLNVGRMHNDWDPGVGMMTDVFGSVVILSGSSDKVNGSVKATVAGRFYTDDSSYVFDGLVVNLSVGLGF